MASGNSPNKAALAEMGGGSGRRVSWPAAVYCPWLRCLFIYKILLENPRLEAHVFSIT